jgi:DNA-binding NtrC family response regulator
MQPRLLIVDDQRDVLAALRLALGRQGIDLVTAGSVAGALAAVASEQFDAALIDLNYERDTTSGIEGLQLLERLRQIDPVLPVIIMTAWASVDLAVKVTRAGARDFIEKPWDNARLLSVVRNQLELGRALRAGRRLEAENALLRGIGGQPPLVSESPMMREVLTVAQRVARANAPILITGENGTGKTMLARLIHEWSARERPLIEVNVGALPDGVFESEMFGHVRGAFTDARGERVGRVELADGGTLFLDEIGNLPLSQQAKLLRVLESGEFEPVGSSRTRKADVRLIAATNAQPHLLVAEGRFREDLLFRINTIELRVPPLRERRADIVPLALAALAAAGRRYGRTLCGFDLEALHALQQYAWPGNVRELHNIIERAVLLAPAEQVSLADLRLGPVNNTLPTLEDMSLEDAERILIRAALKRQHGSVADAAQALGLSRSALYRRMEKLGIAADA